MFQSIIQYYTTHFILIPGKCLTNYAETWLNLGLTKKGVNICIASQFADWSERVNLRS